LGTVWPARALSQPGPRPGNGSRARIICAGGPGGSTGRSNRFHPNLPSPRFRSKPACKNGQWGGPSGKSRMRSTAGRLRRRLHPCPGDPRCCPRLRFPAPASASRALRPLPTSVRTPAAGDSCSPMAGVRASPAATRPLSPVPGSGPAASPLQLQCLDLGTKRVRLLLGTGQLRRRAGVKRPVTVGIRAGPDLGIFQRAESA